MLARLLYLDSSRDEAQAVQQGEQVGEWDIQAHLRAAVLPGAALQASLPHCLRKHLILISQIEAAYDRIFMSQMNARLKGELQVGAVVAQYCCTVDSRDGRTLFYE